MSALVIYAGLFAIAFLAATLLPVQSEIVLAGLLANGGQPWGWLIFFATLGNTLGALVNWGLGLAIDRFRHRPWFPVTDAQLLRAEYYYKRWGRWCLFFSWLPVFGDAFTVLAGVLREKLWVFTVIVGAGKFARYCVVAAGVAGFWVGS